MTETIDPRINDPFTRAQLRLIKQRLADQKRRYGEVSSGSSSNRDDYGEENSPRARLHQSLIRRQQLLNKLKYEDNLHGFLRSPAARRTPGSSPDRQYSRPPSRLSLPDLREKRERTHLVRPLSRRSFRNDGAAQHQPNIWRRDPDRINDVVQSHIPKQRQTVVTEYYQTPDLRQRENYSEHPYTVIDQAHGNVATKAYTTRLQNTPQHMRYPSQIQRPQHVAFSHSPQVAPQQAEHTVGDVPYPRQVVEHQIKPMRLDPLEAQPRVQVHTPTVLSVPQPYIINATPSEPTRAHYSLPATQTKQDMMEMMMLQNAQMHQMMMNQMMISTLPKPQQPRTVGLEGNKVAVDIDEIISLKSEMRNKSEQVKRPPSVHHHHYDTSPSVRPPPHLPPLPQTYPAQGYPSHQYSLGQNYNVYQSPRYYPTEVPPLKQPVARPKPQPKTPDLPKRHYGALPFPGPWPLRRFRHAAYAALFAKALQKAIKKPHAARAPKSVKQNEDFLFVIKLKEIVAAIHHVFLKPTNKIGATLPRVTSDTSRDLSIVLAPPPKSSKSTEQTKAYTEALQVVSEIIEGFAFEITEIMPPKGVLGTHRKAQVYEMIQPGKLFPRSYLWNIEKDMLTLDYQGRTVTVSDREAFILLTGIFIGRALVTTLLLRPLEYGVTQTRPVLNSQKNLRLLSSIFIYLLRKVYTDPGAPILVPAPEELGVQIHGDKEMTALYTKLKSSFDYAEALLTNWGKEYVKRLNYVKRSDTRQYTHRP